MTFAIGPKGLQIIKDSESCKLRAYPDPKTGGAPWTIGWGHTGPDVRPGLVWTQAQADAALVRDLAGIVRDVNILVAGVPTTQNQFDALVSFAFNAGPDMDHDGKAEGLGDSTLLKRHRQGRYAEAAAEFGKWINEGSNVERGLRIRRSKEKALYLS